MSDAVEHRCRMIYSRDFFDLQIAFAESVANRTGLPLEHVLFESTNLYVRLGCGRDFNAGSENWRAYLAGLADADDARDYTYSFYLRDAESRTAPPVVASFGCFSYEIRDGGVVRLHFNGATDGERSPLDRACADERRAEITALARHLRESGECVTDVTGTSWLYNLEAYRRLFPPAYVAAREVAPGRFRHMARWGQFVNRHGGVRGGIARAFLASLDDVRSIDDLESAFPLQAYWTRASVEEFCAHYGVR